MDNRIPITDMHCHILPMVDDGSQSLEQTMAMIDMAYSQGVRRIIATPHYHIGKMMVDSVKVKSTTDELSAILSDKYPEISLYPGNEIYYYSDAMKDIREHRAVTLANSRYMLWEFSPDEQYDTIGYSVYEAVSNGYIPVLAHIERYICLMDRDDLIEQLIDEGACIQVNSGSVAGNNGKKTQKFIKKLLRKKMIQFVASDAHSDITRAPRFDEAVKIIMKYCNADCKGYTAPEW